MTRIGLYSNISPVQEGSEWVWLINVGTRAGVIMKQFSIAKVIEKSGMTPHGEIMDRGYNLLIHTNGYTSVWATFEQCISRGLLVEKSHFNNHIALYDAAILRKRFCV